ncbi:MAG: nitrous oxide reductase accessory protein NosL [Bacteroidia bacterium]
MKSVKLSWNVQIVLILCSILLVVVLFQPIWRIELSAPQYPEGLVINISGNGLGGNVDIINGLNHYIGMKTLHNEDFIEFKILPYLISAFAIFFLLVALLRKPKLMYALFFSFLLFGIVAMVDFWKWEYNYGHNLDPHAAIIVPGMTYQPPLLGYKQLLNFGAYSIPDIGAWLFIVVGLLLLGCVISVYRSTKQIKRGAFASIITLGVFSFSSCSVGSEPIKIGSDNCHFCKMTIMDNRFGAEIVTKKGKVFKYDDSHCLLSSISKKDINMADVKDIYFTDFCEGHSLIKGQNVFYLKSDKLGAPMGGELAAFSSLDSLKSYEMKLGGEEIKWNQVIAFN